ncbi:MAG: amidohydrolase, partial [Lentisphaeria bacterium]|nr:amidohydrolase [Lentisphaeria bacterium]
ALKRRLCDAIENRAEEMHAIGDAIWARPETGFREENTSRIVRETFAALGLPHKTGLAVTGVRADWRSGRPGPTIAVFGELDSIILPSHPAADPVTGAVHACGHNAQIASMLGCAMAFVDTGIGKELAGNIAFIAVPAEEYLELEFRRGLAAEGKIEFLSGKSEMIRLGVFDDIDLALMAHTGVGRTAHAPDSMNGFVVKNVTFQGRAAHAGLAPEEGINALKAATLAINAINAQRETFPDADAIRVHEVITRGGDALNVVPDVIKMQTKVRAKTVEAVLATAKKVERCLKSGALAVGGGVEIDTLTGYLPLMSNPQLAEVFLQNARELIPGLTVSSGGHRGSSTDMGDISQIMPAIHPHIGGAEGKLHGTDFRFADKQLAYIDTAKVLAGCLVDLLSDDAEVAERIRRDAPPTMSKDQYLAYMQDNSARECHDFRDA